MVLKVWERSEGSQNQVVGSCYQTRDQSGQGFPTMSKTPDFQVRLGFFLFFLFTMGLSQITIDCMSCKYKLDFVCRLKINHAWSASSSWVFTTTPEGP